MLDGHHDLGDDFQFAVHKHVERVGNDTFGGVLHGDYTVGGSIFFHLAEDLSDGFLWHIGEAGTEAAYGGLMGVGGFRTEKGNLEALLQRDGGAHHLAVNVPKGFIRQDAVGNFADATQESLLAVGLIDGLAGGELRLTNAKDVLGAAVQQLDNLGVNLVNRAAMFLDAHEVCDASSTASSSPPSNSSSSSSSSSSNSSSS